ncbi:MAG: hypothetical protein Q8Q31_00545 [Nanoarchaeota archaeon]|nr:hypothetical protein [Nanoarchaeota archaeon]
MEIQRELEEMAYQTVTCYPGSSLPRRVILNVTYDGFEKDIEATRREFQHSRKGKKVQPLPTNRFLPVTKETTIYSIRRNRPNIDVPHPLQELDFTLLMENGELSGFTTFNVHPLGDVREELSANLEREAQKRNFIWASGGSEEGKGYLVSQFQLEQGLASESLAVLGTYTTADNLLGYSVAVGLENACRKLSPLRNMGDVITHVSPLEWITEVVINTYMKIAERQGVPTLDARVPSIKLNISL